MTSTAPGRRPEPLHYAAFTADPAGGNPAGVVLDAAPFTDEERLGLAARLGYSETAFLTADPDRPRGYAVRYFSPLAEVPFCGHATIAAAVALGERHGPGEFLFTTPAGPVPVAVTGSAADGYRATLTSVPATVEDAAEADVAEALAALRWRAEELDRRLPPRIAYAGARHLVLAAATRARLADLDYDFDALAALMRRLDLTTLQLVWEQDAATYHVRDPFPVGGVVEDPATGAAAAAFGGYLRELRGLTTARLTLHQGEDLGRPGVLTVDLVEGDGRVRVTGRAVPMG
ncbi:PhzF family phenazine biosynthesis protein [Kitasatospora sp. SolWspMP-SS2h]|uniref:PhzF family phenazine biosynthesis protein n=1 Tax=Kitasatospora sp. SolWspMP-SS2h TaxID=1305729 RepID=UPI000DBA8153|nr:PhzF family phenazine biosynthesis isomerase [Kitasatospora sp. SolWspMP-SS2h]RAJ33240.1 PhzF family phenazine biosynthesis protein [Kitasatospora sp. SolWspMP-SS2h]